MELRSLRCFQAVAELGSYSKGAAYLNLSQPAVSRQVAKLEAELGRALFHRHGHGVRLTDAGRVFLERSQSVLRQLEQAKAEMRDAPGGPSGILTLAVPPGAANYLVPPLVERFRRRYPDVLLQIVSGFSGHIREWVASGRVDLACLHDPAPMRGFAIVALVREEIFLVGPPDDTRIDGRVRLSTLPALPLILPSRSHRLRQRIDTMAAAKGLHFDLRAEVDGQAIIRTLVKRGIGFSLLTRGAIEADVRSGVVRAFAFQPSLSWTFAMVAQERAPDSELREALSDTVRAVCRDLTASGEWPGESLDPEFQAPGGDAVSPPGNATGE